MLLRILLTKIVVLAHLFVLRHMSCESELCEQPSSISGQIVCNEISRTSMDQYRLQRNNDKYYGSIIHFARHNCLMSRFIENLNRKARK